MPQYLGGDIVELVCNHPDLGDFRFQIKSNESFNVDPGGLRSVDDMNMITGGGQMIDQVNRSRWKIEGPVSTDFLSENELLNLPLLAESSNNGVWTLSHVSGVIWKGTGKPVGDLVADSNTAQLPLIVSGGGRLEKIS